MGKDKRGEKVEKWKLTDEQKNWTKKYKVADRMKQMLQNATLIEKRRIGTLSSLWKLLSGTMNELLETIPQEKITELQGMDFSERLRENASFQGAQETQEGSQEAQEASSMGGPLPSQEQQMIRY